MHAEYPSGSSDSLQETGRPWDLPLDFSQDTWAHSTNGTHLPVPPHPQGNAREGDSTGAGTSPPPPRQYLQEHLSRQPVRGVPAARVALGFQWAQQHRPAPSPREIPGRAKKVVYFKDSTCMHTTSQSAARSYHSHSRAHRGSPGPRPA